MRFLALCALLAPLLLARPADAQLGGTLPAFQHSPLIQGEELFRYEGRVGARYLFDGGRRCRFGNGHLALDIDHEKIVQEILVLPLPVTMREQVRLDAVARLFLSDAGLDPALVPDALRDFQAAYTNGKRIDRPLGKTMELHTRCNPGLDAVLLSLNLKQ